MAGPYSGLGTSYPRGSGAVDLRVQSLLEEIASLQTTVTELEGKVAALEARVTALEGKTKSGGITLTWPGGSQFTNVVGIAHGLGVNPSSAEVSMGVASDGGIENVVGILVKNAGELQVRGFRTTGAPGAGVTAAVFWFVTK